MVAKVLELEFDVKGDERGKLIPLESLSEQVPFEIRRVYFIFDTTPGTVRGKHAHRELKQVLICVSGACTIVCERANGARTEHRLDWPTKGLLIEGCVWREMKDFSKDAVLLVLANERYDPADYIRDRAEFDRKGENA